MKEGTNINLKVFSLGVKIIRFSLPMELIDSINKAYDENSKNLKPHNDKLAGKIAEENRIDKILNSDILDVFLWCFREYLVLIGIALPGLKDSRYNPVLSQGWINEMKAGEYNPMHMHTSPDSEVGLSSVLMLKRPDWYGVEASREESPANGWLEFTGGDQSPLARPQMRVDAQVGDFYVFPYSLAHGVYPFNGTDEVRRTMSYNCDLIKTGK